MFQLREKKVFFNIELKNYFLWSKNRKKNFFFVLLQTIRFSYIFGTHRKEEKNGCHDKFFCFSDTKKRYFWFLIQFSFDCDRILLCCMSVSARKIVFATPVGTFGYFDAIKNISMNFIGKKIRYAILMDRKLEYV